MDNGKWTMDNCQLLTVNSQLKKGCKQTEIGIIPEDWKVATIGELCACFSGGTPSTSDPSYYGGDIPWITSGDLNKIRITEVEGRITAEGLANSATKMVNAGTLLLALYGATAGVSAITQIRAAINQAVLAILPKWLTTEYLFQFLRFRKDSYIKTYTQGGQPNFSGEIVKSFVIPLPTKAEQTAIATALSDADALISSLEKLIAKKRNIKQGAMQQLLTGKKRLPGFSGKWEVKKLGEIAQIDPENLGSDTSPNYAFRYISLEDVDYGTLRGHTEQVFRIAPSRARRKVRKGDVLVSTVRPNLKSHLLIRDDVVDTVCSTGFSVVRYKPTLADPAFIFAHLFAGSLERQIESLLTGSNYPAINSSDVKALQISCPSLPEQTAIAQVLSDMDAEIEALEKKLEKYKMIKQGMMQSLLTGKIRLV